MKSRTLIFLVALALLIGCAIGLIPTEADAGSPLELRKVALDFEQFLPGGRDPLITDNGLPDRTLGQGLDLMVNIDVLKYGYWENTIHSETDAVMNPDGSTSTGQFRMVGWEYALGVDFRRIFSWLPVRIGARHYSRHCLDCTYPFPYPVQNSIGGQLIIYER